MLSIPSSSSEYFSNGTGDREHEHNNYYYYYYSYINTIDTPLSIPSSSSA